MSSNTLEEMRLRLPQHLAKWLQEFSKAIAMTPDQLITHILEYYYESWKVGYYEGRKFSNDRERSCLNLDEALTSFLETLSKSRRKNATAILKHFTTWLCEKRVSIVSKEIVNEFLEQYTAKKNLKASTLYFYRYMLQRFIKFYEERVSPTRANAN